MDTDAEREKMVPNIERSEESEERQLCMKCMAPNDPEAHFCAKCGAPLSFYAATGPFEHLFAEGAVYREAAERPQNLIVVLGIWIIFGTIASVGTCIVALQLANGSRLDFLMFGVLFALTSLVVISILILVKTTRNYLAKRRRDKGVNASS